MDKKSKLKYSITMINKINSCRKSQEEITKNLKYIKNIREIKNMVIFECFCEGIELLKNANKLTIITSSIKEDAPTKKMTNRIKKLKIINPTIDITITSTILCDAGIIQLFM